MKYSALLLSLFLSTGFANAAETIDVYKSKYCGCCKKWVEYMEAEGFTLKVIEENNLAPIKEKAGITPATGSCHTAMVDGYFIEGHVPAADVRRLLEQRPDIRGIAVPGMPMGSPGMEGNRKDAYDVIAVHKDGSTSVFSHHE